MYNDRQYWLGFSAFPGIGPLRFKLLLDYFGSAKRAWEASRDELVTIGLGQRLTIKFDRFRRDFDVNGYVKRVKDLGIAVLTLTDNKYPRLLKEISDPPFVLYVRGKRIREPWNIEQSIGVVGTRKVTNYGRTITQKLVNGLASSGFTIVSGLAFGVDAVAHETAVSSGAKTIAVLGCGVDCCYPRSNQWLYDRIIDGNGVILSEFPISRRASKGLFPARNRIISGLSLGVVVTEGAKNSGALITARCAAEQGREVFAVPGPVTSAYSRATSRLLKSGATLVETHEDVIQTLNYEKYVKTMQNKQSTKTTEEAAIVEALSIQPLRSDEIVRKLDLNSGKVAGILSVLEIRGIIRGEDGVYSLQ